MFPECVRARRQHVGMLPTRALTGHRSAYLAAGQVEAVDVTTIPVPGVPG
jgi:hypothetical protein